MALGGLAAAIVALLVLRAAPRVGVALWLVVLFFVPVWIGVSVGPFWSAITAITIAMIMTCSTSIVLSPADGLMAAFALLIVAQYALDLTTLSGAVIALSEWLLPYIWGRLILTRVSLDFLIRAISVVAIVAAGLAILESITATNFFVMIAWGDPGLYNLWAELQPRGGLVRVEGAFGHSIALGASLSMCAAFVLATKWRLTIRLIVLLGIAAAIMLTLSRIGLVTFVITVALSIIVLPGLTRAARVMISAAALAAAFVIVPFVSGVFLEAGQEADGSANYRLDLLSLGLVIRPFGAAPDITGLTVNGEYLGTFSRSIDNALMVVAMRVGWVPTLLLITVLVIAVGRVFLKRGANVANIALTGQLPGLFAVAFITQYSAFFWFTVGLAIELGLDNRRRARETTPDKTTSFTSEPSMPSAGILGRLSPERPGGVWGGSM